jgi:hypothetical protein
MIYDNFIPHFIAKVGMEQQYCPIAGSHTGDKPLREFVERIVFIQETEYAKGQKYRDGI